MNTPQIKNKSILGLQALFIATILFVTNFTFGINKDTNTPFFTAPLKTTNKRGRVDFVEDADGKKFILKYNTRGVEYAIHDTLGATVGQSVGVNINSVKIFPPQDTSISSVDRFPTMVKTLHTHVPGEQVCNIETMQKDIYIQGGLTHMDNLNSITKNKKLRKKAALDTYLDNWDGHIVNLFYDKDNDQFYAIDMDMIFCRNKDFLLSSGARRFLKFRKKYAQFSVEEKQALASVNKNLEKLTSEYPPEKLYDKRTEIAKEAHHTYNASEQEKFRTLIEHNFKETKRLQVLLNNIVNDTDVKSFQILPHTIYKKPISTHFIFKNMAKPSKIAEQNFQQTMNS